MYASFKQKVIVLKQQEQLATVSRTNCFHSHNKYVKIGNTEFGYVSDHFLIETVKNILLVSEFQQVQKLLFLLAIIPAMR